MRASVKRIVTHLTPVHHTRIVKPVSLNASGTRKNGKQAGDVRVGNQEGAELVGALAMVDVDETIVRPQHDAVAIVLERE